MNTIRVATYNVHKCQGMDGRTRPDRIARVIGEINPDVIALQEVLSIAGARPEWNQSAYLGAELGYHWVKGETRRLHGGVYGNMVLSRFPFENTRHHDISVPGREERGVLRADVEVDGLVLHLFNAHLGTSYFERRQQAQRFLTADLLRAADIDGPRIVLGDFNEWTRGLVTRLLSNEMRRVDAHWNLGRARTYPALLPVLHLDYIYYDHSLHLRDAFFHRSRTALAASDHLPLVADFRVL